MIKRIRKAILQFFISSQMYIVVVLSGILAVGVFKLLSKKDIYVKKNELTRALLATGYQLKFRRVPVPPGWQEVVAGRATDKTGKSSVDFVFLRSAEGIDGARIESSASRPVIPYLDFRGEGLGNISFISNDSRPASIANDD